MVGVVDKEALVAGPDILLKNARVERSRKVRSRLRMDSSANGRMRIREAGPLVQRLEDGALDHNPKTPQITNRTATSLSSNASHSWT